MCLVARPRWLLPPPPPPPKQRPRGSAVMVLKLFLPSRLLLPLPVQLSFMAVVYPSLTLTYLGQTAMIVNK